MQPFFNIIMKTELHNNAVDSLSALLLAPEAFSGSCDEGIG